MGGVWHPECLPCHACNLPISGYKFYASENHPFHISCYKEHHQPTCDICKNFIPRNAAGLVKYLAHPLWLQKSCPSHEHDGTPRCYSCERMEPRYTKTYVLLDDGQKLCQECLDSAIMDTHECQPLYLQIQEFFEGLNMKIEQKFPLLLVERKALNRRMEGEGNLGHHQMPDNQGRLRWSEEQTVGSNISRSVALVVKLFTEPKLKVAAIHILRGLPRLLTGSILARLMMQAWLHIKGYSDLPPDVKQGICLVLAHMWLDFEIQAGFGSSVALTLSSSSSSSAASASSKKGNLSQFEKQLGELFKLHIESTDGNGFKEGNKAVLKYGLKRTLDHIRLRGTFPCE